MEIPPLFYSQILRSAVYVSDVLVSWTTTNTVCHQLFGHLDADASGGVSAMLFLCTPPTMLDTPSPMKGVVRSLYAPVRQIGERPSPFPSSFPIMVGTEAAIADLTPRYNRPLVFSEHEIQAFSTPFPQDVKSLILLPLQRRGRIAGCFLVSSHTPGYFETRARQQIVHEYGILISFAFLDQDFYDPQQIQLANFPSFAEQREQEARYPFRLGVEELRDRFEEAAGRDSQTLVPNQEQLEILALQELEQRLITWRKHRHSLSMETSS